MLRYEKESYWQHLRRGLLRMLPIVAILVFLFALFTQLVCSDCTKQLIKNAAKERSK
jgi:hypothetical protein